MAKTKGDGVSKAQGVREAMANLGADAKPQAIQDYLKQHHGIEMDATMISSYKSNELKKGGKVGRSGKSGNIIDDIGTIKGLLKKHSKGELISLIEALS